MPYPLLRGAGTLALASAIAAAAQAQQAPAHTPTPVAVANPSALGEVVVTATRTAEPITQVPASVSVVTAAQVRETPGQGLNDILQLEPGLVLNQIGPFVGHPTAYNESMRGLPATETRMLVLMDSVPLNDPFFGYIQWNRVPLDNVDRVEIVRGGGSPLWGNSAMGGVINVITRAPTSDELDIDAAGGSYGTYRADAYGAMRVNDKLALALNAGFDGTGGYQTTPASWNSFGTTTLRSPVYTPTTFNARNVGVRADAAPTSDLTASVTVDYHGNHQVLQTPIGDDSQSIWTYSGQVKKTFANGGSLTASIFHDDSYFVTNNPHLLTFTTEYISNVHYTPVNDTGGSLIWQQTLNSILKSYMVGIDAHYIAGGDFANYYLPSGALAAPTIVGSGKQLFLGGFVQARLEPVRHLEIVGSVRYQYYENYDAIDTFPPAIAQIPASSKVSTDPRVDVRYALNDTVALRGAYYESFRAPTLDQLYRTFADTTAGIFEGNPLLKPETLHGGEVGADFNRPGFRSQISFYDTTISNLITQRNLPASDSPTALGVECGFDAATFTFLTCTQNINSASAIARGIEVEADWDLGRGLTATFAYTYTDSHYTSNPEDPAAVGERLEDVPMHNVSGRLAYRGPRGWVVETDLRWVSKSYGDNNPADNLIQNAHFVMDASVSYPLTHSLQAYVQIQNLTDTVYIANNSGGAPILGTPLEVLGGFRLSLR
ncbi:MAG TPA: TonB-dependent receptor [Caulobacteraceae bacterium]|jgi:outer membrane receptor protein involved in Fe transport